MRIRDSLRYAQLLAKRPNGNLLHQCDRPPISTDTGNLRRRVAPPYVALVNMDVNLEKLEEIIKASAWLRNIELEPCIGDPNCPAEADPHGISGLSVYTAFVKSQNGDAHGCKYARCSAYPLRCMEASFVAPVLRWKRLRLKSAPTQHRCVGHISSPFPVTALGESTCILISS